MLLQVGREPKAKQQEMGSLWECEVTDYGGRVFVLVVRPPRCLLTCT